MAKIVRLVILSAIIVFAAFALGGCQYFAFLNPAWGLQGTWKITARPDYLAYEAFAYIVFLEGAEGYQIQDENRTVWQSGSILNFTDDSYEYKIEENTLFPEFLGAENYAEYVLDTNDLTLVLYTDRDKSAQIGTLICTRE